MTCLPLWWKLWLCIFTSAHVNNGVFTWFGLEVGRLRFFNRDLAESLRWVFNSNFSTNLQNFHPLVSLLLLVKTLSFSRKWQFVMACSFERSVPSQVANFVANLYKSNFCLNSETCAVLIIFSISPLSTRNEDNSRHVNFPCKIIHSKWPRRRGGWGVIGVIATPSKGEC